MSRPQVPRHQNIANVQFTCLRGSRRAASQLPPKTGPLQWALFLLVHNEVALQNKKRMDRFGNRDATAAVDAECHQPSLLPNHCASGLSRIALDADLRGLFLKRSLVHPKAKIRRDIHEHLLSRAGY